MTLTRCQTPSLAERSLMTEQSMDRHHHAYSHRTGGQTAKGALVKDPVCGMNIDPAASPHQAEHAGQTYHFCSAGCRAKFVKRPGRI